MAVGQLLCGYGGSEFHSAVAAIQLSRGIIGMLNIQRRYNSMAFKRGEPNPGFKPGQSGNPLGRPKGSRNKLSEDFVAALSADFDEHGPDVIATVRATSPVDYVRAIVALVPKQVTVADASLDDMSDSEIIDLLAAVRSLAAANSAKKAGDRSSEATSPKGTGPARRTH